MKSLTCVGAYFNGARGLRFRPGERFELTDSVADWLLRDAPGCFVETPAAPEAGATSDVIGPRGKRARVVHRAVLEPREVK